MIWILGLIGLFAFTLYSRKIFYKLFLIENCLIHPLIAKKIDTLTAIKIKNNFELALKIGAIIPVSDIKKITDETKRIIMFQHISSAMKSFIIDLMAAGNINQSVIILANYYKIKEQDIAEAKIFYQSITGNI